MHQGTYRDCRGIEARAEGVTFWAERKEVRVQPEEKQGVRWQNPKDIRSEVQQSNSNYSYTSHNLRDNTNQSREESLSNGAFKYRALQISGKITRREEYGNQRKGWRILKKKADFSEEPSLRQQICETRKDFIQFHDGKGQQEASCCSALREVS